VDFNPRSTVPPRDPWQTNDIPHMEKKVEIKRPG